MPETMRQRLGPDLLLPVWRRRKWLGLATFAMILAAAASLAAFVPDRFRGTATVIVERRGTDASMPSADTDEMETRLRTIGEKILSRAQLEGLIQRFNLYREQREEGASAESIIEQMRRDTHLELRGVDPLSGRGMTVSFSLSYWGDDPKTAAEVANTIATSYVEDNRRSRERQASSSATFLKAQLDEAKTHLDVSSAQQARLIGRRDALTKRLSSMEPANSPRSMDAMRLANLRQELSGLLTQYKDSHPVILRTRGEIKALEQRVAGATPDGGGVDGAAIQQVKNALAQADSEVLSSDYATARDHYLSLMKLYEEARLNENKEQEAQGVQFAILDPAVVPDQPASPNRLRILLGGLVVSIGIALGSVVAAERFDTTFHAVDDLSAFTRIPILASISRIATRRETWRDRFRLLLGFFLAAIGLLLVVGMSYYVAHRAGALLLMILGGRP